MVGMLVGISALTTIGLRRYYAEQATCRRPPTVCGGTPVRGVHRPAPGGRHRPGADGLRRRGRCAPWSRRCSRWCCSGRRRRGRCAPATLRSRLALPCRDRRLRRPARRQPRVRRRPSTLGGFDGVAHAGVAIVTCMDSRIDPLRHARPAARRRQDLPQPRRPGHRRRRSRRWCSACTCSASSGSWSSRTPAARWPRTPRRAARAGRRVGRAGRLLAALPRRRGPGRPRSPRTSAKVRAHPLIPDARRGRRLPVRRRHRAAARRV